MRTSIKKKRCLVVVSLFIVLFGLAAPGIGYWIYTKYESDRAVKDVKVCEWPNAWTPWIDRDDPSSKGDFETLAFIRIERPWVCAHPTEIDAEIVGGRGDYSLGGNIIEISKEFGLACVNRQQPGWKYCRDYQVRFCCPVSDLPTASPLEKTAESMTVKQSTTPNPVGVCEEPNNWTPWIDRDNPSGSGDYETLLHIRQENPWVCANPTGVDAELMYGDLDYSLGGNNIEISKELGLVCVNSQQPKGKYCKDYQVRFCC